MIRLALALAMRNIVSLKDIEDMNYGDLEEAYEMHEEMVKEAINNNSNGRSLRQRWLK